MRALIVDHAAPGRLSIKEVGDPSPGPDQVLIKVAATSLNHGEIPRERTPSGTVPGWDAAGVVVQQALNGRGPAVGARVASRNENGGWAELRVANVDDTAILPDGLDFGVGAAIPIAGVSALRALRRLGSIVGRRILITGASGGVGRYAIQLAARAGAEVIAAVGRPERGKGLEALGANEVVVGLGDIKESLFGVIDNVGGHELVEAFGLLERGGAVICVGATSGVDSVFPPYSTVGPERSIIAFQMGPAIGDDIGYLARLIDHGQFDPQIGWRSSWERGGEAAEALLARQVLGKAVLDIS